MPDTKTQTHEMKRSTVYPSGAEEWLCNSCQRHFIVRWQPVCIIIELDAGDIKVGHRGSTGSTGGLRFKSSEDKELDSGDLGSLVNKTLKGIGGLNPIA